MAAPVTLRNFRDAHIQENRATKNYVNTARLAVSAVAGQRRRAFLFFSKPYPPGVTITDGKLRVWNSEAWTGSVTLTAELIGAGWAGSRINWNNQPSVLGVPASIAVTKSNAAKDTMWEFNIMPFLQFVANGGAWFGIRISTSSTSVLKIYSAQAEASELRPQVLVQWADAPEPPDGLEPSGNTAVSSAKPVLSYDFTDVSGDVNLAQQRIQIDDATDFATPIYDSGWVPATEPIFDLNAPTAPAPAFTGLTNLQSVYWRAMVQDGAGVPSEWSTFDGVPPAQFRRVDKGTLASTAVGTRLQYTNLIKSPRTKGTFWSVSDAGVTLTDVVGGGFTVAINGAATNQGVFADPAQMDDYTTWSVGDTWSTRVRWKANAAGTYEIYGGNVLGTGIAVSGGLIQTKTITAGEVGLQQETVFNGLQITAGTPTAGNGPYIIIRRPASGAAAVITVDAVLLVKGVSTAPEFFDGASVDTDVIGPNLYAWTSTANASSSTQSQLYVEDSSPTVAWSLSGGRTQTAYQVIIALADAPDDPLWDTGKVTSTTTFSATTPDKLLKSKTAVYRITIRVWDDIQRQKEGTNPIYYEWIRDFVYAPGTSVTAPAGLTVALTDPWPWVDVTFTRTTPPDSFSIYRDNELIDNNILPGDIYTGGTSYTYRDRTAPPRVAHTWTVVANVNGVDSQPTAGASATTKPGFSWMMERDGGNPIALVKSASEPTPAVDAQAMSMQEVHQPVGGSSPVLITQFIAGFEGHVDAVLSDDVVPGLSGRTMRDRFKRWKRNPGTVLLLYMVDEVLQVVPYNMTYRPRARGGGKVIYDVSFDFFEVNY